MLLLYLLHMYIYPQEQSTKDTHTISPCNQNSNKGSFLCNTTPVQFLWKSQGSGVCTHRNTSAFTSSCYKCLLSKCFFRDFTTAKFSVKLQNPIKFLPCLKMPQYLTYQSHPYSPCSYHTGDRLLDLSTDCHHDDAVPAHAEDLHFAYKYVHSTLKNTNHNGTL